MGDGRLKIFKRDPCIVCGNKISKLKRSKYCSMPCATKKWGLDGRKRGITQKRLIRYKQIPERVYPLVKADAKRRLLEFKITVNEFKRLWSMPCYYCGDIVETVGIDRVDNNIGYIIDNVVSCCVLCNMMKKNYLKELFINHCKKVANYNE